MTTPTRQLLLTAVLAAAVLVTGCDADRDGVDDQTGQPGAGAAPDPDNQAGTRGGSCDPHGFGPLSGCGSSGPGQDGVSGIGDSVPLDPAAPDPACPAELYAEFDDDTGEVTHTDPPVSQACLDELNAENAAFDAALEAGPPARDWTVTQTVVTGPGECVIGLDEIGGDDHHSRRPTTLQDCQAHPPGSTYHTEGGW